MRRMDNCRAARRGSRAHLAKRDDGCALRPHAQQFDAALRRAQTDPDFVGGGRWRTNAPPGVEVRS